MKPSDGPSTIGAPSSNSNPVTSSPASGSAVPLWNSVASTSASGATSTSNPSDTKPVTGVIPLSVIRPGGKSMSETPGAASAGSGAIWATGSGAISRAAAGAGTGARTGARRGSGATCMSPSPKSKAMSRIEARRAGRAGSGISMVFAVESGGSGLIAPRTTVGAVELGGTDVTSAAGAGAGAATGAAGAASSTLPISNAFGAATRTDEATEMMRFAIGASALGSRPSRPSRATRPPTCSMSSSTSSFRRSNSSTRSYQPRAAVWSPCSRAISPRWRRAIRFSGSTARAASKGPWASACRPDSNRHCP